MIENPQMNALVEELVGHAEAQRGRVPSDPFRDALGRFLGMDAADRQAGAAALAARLPDIESCSGAGLLAVLFGSLVESGGDPKPAIPVIAETMVRWCRRIPSPDDGTGPAGAVPAVEDDVPTGTSYLGQALVAHLVRAGQQKAALARDGSFIDDLERVEAVSNGAAWVLQLLRQRSGRLLAIEVERRMAALLDYRNLSNCFHLFTLIQAELADVLADGREADPAVLAAAENGPSGVVSDEAWWHYGPGTVAEPDIAASIWGEASPAEIPEIDGIQVLVLWPALLGSRTWDGAFFAPYLEAAPPSVEFDRLLRPVELEHWWGRLRLPET